MTLTLQGIIDMHVHTAPDVQIRKCNDFELVDTAVQAGARAIVIKSHLGSTAERAALCNDYNQRVHGKNGFTMYGGLVLNQTVGGLNPAAVRAALKLGAKVIWLPTVDSLNHRVKHGKSGGLTVLDEIGQVKNAVEEIMCMVRDWRIVLATGHLSPVEIYKVADLADRLGLEKLVITHPEFWVVGLTHHQQAELVRQYGVILERCCRQPLPDDRWYDNLPDTCRLIHELGCQHILLSTDSGQPENPAWAQQEMDMLHFLLENGISAEAIRKMTQDTPAGLLDDSPILGDA